MKLLGYIFIFLQLLFLFSCNRSNNEELQRLLKLNEQVSYQSDFAQKLMITEVSDLFTLKEIIGFSREDLNKYSVEVPSNWNVLLVDTIKIMEQPSEIGLNIGENVDRINIQMSSNDPLEKLRNALLSNLENKFGKASMGIAPTDSNEFEINYWWENDSAKVSLSFWKDNEKYMISIDL